MAIRRRQGITTTSSRTFSISDDPSSSAAAAEDSASSYSTSSSLAAQAIRASAAHRDSSLSSAYSDSAFHQYSSSSFKDKDRDRDKDSHNKDKDHSKSKSEESATYDYTSMKSTTEPGGFWGVLARKAKAILEDGNISEQLETPIRTRSQMVANSTGDQFNYSYQSFENSKKMDNPRLRKGLDALTSSLNHIGGTIGNALEEGRTMVENKTADIIQETRKLQIRKKGNDDENQVSSVHSLWKQSSMQPTQHQLLTNQETQLKASRDVAMATAAKAKLLLRELKSVKADLAFAKQRCSQLEDENRALREAREKGGHPADDDMIRLQLETLLAEKARLAHENSVYARENRFLREIVEYHQLTVQDVVYLDECIEEVTEVYNISAVSSMLSTSPTSPKSPRSPPEISPSMASQTSDSQTETVPVIVSWEASTSILQSDASECSSSVVSPARDNQDSQTNTRQNKDPSNAGSSVGEAGSNS